MAYFGGNLNAVGTKMGTVARCFFGHKNERMGFFGILTGMEGRDRSSAWGESPADDTQGARNSLRSSLMSLSESLLPAGPPVYSSLLSIRSVVSWSTNPLLCTLLSPPSEQ